MTSRFNGAELGNQIVLQVREFVARSLGTFGERLTQLSTRLDALETRAPVPGPQGERGEPGPAGKDATGLTAEDVQIRIDIESTRLMGKVAEVIAGLPKPVDGRAGKDGTSVTLADIQPMLTQLVSDAVAGIPRPKDGAPGLNGEPGAAGRDGRDALQLEILPAVDPERRYPRNTYAKHAGGLIRAFRDTDAINLAEIEKSGWEVVLEGITNETEETMDEGRTIVRKTYYTSGMVFERSIKTSVMLDRGVWRQGTYEKGDVVTWAGSTWIAQRTTEDKPETSDAWRLAVKRGRDGKDK